jgi:hypothetical protein
MAEAVPQATPSRRASARERLRSQPVTNPATSESPAPTDESTRTLGGWAQTVPVEREEASTAPSAPSEMRASDGPRLTSC